MKHAQPNIVHRDRHLIVFDKPSGLPTTSPDAGPCLAQFARQVDPEAPRMHASSRLDAEVTGVVTFARTDRAIQALLDARRRGVYLRVYVGLASQALEPASGEWRSAIGKDARDPRRRVALPEHSRGADAAHTSYARIADASGASLVRLRPHTGRTHQLRVHVAHAGAPLLGDRPYGGPVRVVQSDGRVLRAARVMLHCACVVVPAIEGGDDLVLRAPVPADMLQLWEQLGGDKGAFEVATARPTPQAI